MKFNSNDKADAIRMGRWQRIKVQ